MQYEVAKVAFFSKGDDKFLDEVMNEFSPKYEIKKITITTREEMECMEQWMQWADICWFEWCDDLIVYGSKLPVAKEREIICRLHSYEAFTGYPSLVDWSCVDKLVFVSEHIQKFVIERFKLNKENTVVIPNGVNLRKWTFNNRSQGYNVAYVGYINYKKGPMLLLHTIKAIYDTDDRYKFYIAGKFQDHRDYLYFKQMTNELGLQNNLFFDGWQQDLDQWMEDKNYILCTSVLESQNMSVMQAMAKGIKPVIHNFVGAKGVYAGKYIWNTINEAVQMVTEKDYNSWEYRGFIEQRYSSARQNNAIGLLMDEIALKHKKPKSFDYKEYWNRRLNSKFNIEGVGYLGLGEIYNRFLYQNRMDMLDGIINMSIDRICDKRVLELGPGVGIFTEYFHNKGVGAYEAIDIVEKSANELQSKYASYCFKHGDICDGCHYEAQYDLILAADVLLHITDEVQYEKAISNISQHLNPKGLFILFDPISVIQAKSQSAHVAIRDRSYVESVLAKYGLELIEMLPVAFFMNYPFDRDVLGNRGGFALAMFNLISHTFSGNLLSTQEKQMIGEYLLIKEKQLLCLEGVGLSEKLLIVRKQGNDNNMRFNLRKLLDYDSIANRIITISEKLEKDCKNQQPLLLKINELLNLLHQENNA